MAIKLPQDFKDLFNLLNANGVRYLLIGGYAVVLHGYVRNTNDIDFAVDGDPENAANLVKALHAFGFGGSDLGANLFTKKESLVRMGFEPLKIEIMNYLNGVDFKSAYKNRKVLTLEDVEISLIAVEDLIANKKAVGRHQDLADVEELEKRFSILRVKEENK